MQLLSPLPVALVPPSLFKLLFLLGLSVLPAPRLTKCPPGHKWPHDFRPCYTEVAVMQSNGSAHPRLPCPAATPPSPACSLALFTCESQTTHHWPIHGDCILNFPVRNTNMRGSQCHQVQEGSRGLLLRPPGFSEPGLD